MASNKIDIDQLSMAVISSLQAYADLTLEDVKVCVDQTAKATVRELNELSPEGATGDYKDSWASKRDDSLSGRMKYDKVVYSKKPNYSLTHLLEHGHAKVTGGRVDGFPHISIAANHAEELLVLKIKKSIAMNRK